MGLFQRRAQQTASCSLSVHTGLAPGHETVVTHDEATPISLAVFRHTPGNSRQAAVARVPWPPDRRTSLVGHLRLEKGYKDSTGSKAKYSGENWGDGPRALRQE